jgi:methionyl-tRNA formyltransferase
MAVCPVNDLIRALTPHVGAFVELEGGERLAVRAARPAGDGVFSGLRPGEFAGDDGRLFFGCSDGALELLAVQPAGGKQMDAASYLRGRGVPTAAA